MKNNPHSSVATARKNRQNTSSAIASTRRHRRNRTANTPNLSSNNNQIDELTLCGVVYGLEDEYTNGDETNRRYLTRLHNAIDEVPTLFFPTEREARAMASELGSVLDYWDNPKLRNITLTQAQNNPALSPNFSALFGFLKKAIKKVGKGIKKAAQTVVKGVKTAAIAVAKITKKIGKKIAKVAKKVVKFLIRFNPIVDALNRATTSGWTPVRYNSTEGFVSSQYHAEAGSSSVADTQQAQSDVTSTTIISQPTSNNFSTMGEKIKKYGKYVLIAAGVGIVAYAGYKLMNKSSGGSGGSKRRSLNGVSLKPLRLK